MTHSSAERSADSRPINPGSLSDFAMANGLYPQSHEALVAHSSALDSYRERLAAEFNISLEDLHLLGGRAASMALASELAWQA